MKGLIPFPLLSGVLFFSWLLLVAEVSFAHVFLAGLFAVVIPLLVAPFLDHLPRVKSPLAAVRLILLVTWDIVLANVAVARLVLGPEERLRPAFFYIPLQVTNAQSIALLASIITMTPGTVSADLTDDQRRLLVHALDCPDAEQMIADIKQRYEKPLLEIFGC
jgi:multicomponent K+:H+ antiporter subunit E